MEEIWNDYCNSNVNDKKKKKEENQLLLFFKIKTKKILFDCSFLLVPNTILVLCT